MQCYAIDAVISFENKPAISPFHYDMFHGTFYRGDEYRGAAGLGAGKIRPASLIKNVHNIGNCFMPMNFIISERARGKLSFVENVQFLQVAYKKLFDYPYEKNDKSFYKRMNELGVLDDDLDEAIEGLIESQPNNPSLADRIGPYYEVLCWRYQDVTELFPGAKPTPFKVPFTVTRSAPFDGAISQPMMDKYAILWTEHGHVVRQDVFQNLKSYLDSDYFSWVSFDI